MYPWLRVAEESFRCGTRSFTNVNVANHQIEVEHVLGEAVRSASMYSSKPKEAIHSAEEKLKDILK